MTWPSCGVKEEKGLLDGGTPRANITELAGRMCRSQNIIQNHCSIEVRPEGLRTGPP